jgi:hypothetical protein
MSVATSGQIWIPPKDGTGVLQSYDDITVIEYNYGQAITLNFQNPGDTYYFTASNLTTFTPSLPTGSFPGGTVLGPYYAVSANGSVVMAATDEATGSFYVYLIVITPPPPPPEA